MVGLEVQYRLGLDPGQPHAGKHPTHSSFSVSERLILNKWSHFAKTMNLQESEVYIHLFSEERTWPLRHWDWGKEIRFHLLYFGTNTRM